LVLLGTAVLPSFVEPATGPPDKRPDKRMDQRMGERSETSPIRWSGRSLLLFAALFFLYVGTENAFGGWIASYAKSLGSSSPTLSVMTPSFFYAALMLGRWIANFVLQYTVAFIGMAGLVFSRTLPLVVTSVSVAGLGLAAVYPITISRLSGEFGTAAARVGSIMFIMANLGGAFLPWVVGYSSHEFNDLGVGLAVPVAATALLSLLYYFYQRRLNRLAGKKA
jgi:fucose permease